MSNKYELDEFERRAQQLGKPILSKPEVAWVLGITDMGLWKWSRSVPESMPNWSRAGGVNFLTADEAISWCREFARKHPDYMARRRIKEDEQ